MREEICNVFFLILFLILLLQRIILLPNSFQKLPPQSSHVGDEFLSFCATSNSCLHRPLSLMFPSGRNNVFKGKKNFFSLFIFMSEKPKSEKFLRLIYFQRKRLFLSLFIAPFRCNKGKYEWKAYQIICLG